MFSPEILLPGPTPIPSSVQQAMMTPMSDHRGSHFAPVVSRVRDALANLFQVGPGGAVAVIPASGTGALEAAIQNFFAAGQRVLSISTGAFGDRFAKIAQNHGLSVDKVEVPWGQAFSPLDVVERVAKGLYAGVLVTQNETSTGVLNPVQSLASLLNNLPNSRRPLFIVDSISGVPSVSMEMVDWGVDVVLSASQKGFMCPPGLALVAATERARIHLKTEGAYGYYFDLNPYFEGQLPYTPAVSLWYGLDAALQLLQEEGVQARYARHHTLAKMAREFANAGGWHPIVDEDHASPTVTAIELPPSYDPGDLRKKIARQGLQIAGGMGAWHHHAIRIGHVGAVLPSMLFGGLGTIAHFVPHPDRALSAAWAAWHAYTIIEEV